ncbi:hypothetical protein [Caldimonas sp.]
MSLDTFNSRLETAHLLKSPADAACWGLPSPCPRPRFIGAPSSAA